MKPSHRTHPLWLAFLVHRLSGLLLVLFLPVHFYVLGLSIRETAAFDQFLTWSQQPTVKMAEFGLIFLLSIHLFGGLRIMALEWLPWSPRQKTWVALSVAGSLAIACCFLLEAL